MFRTNAIWLLKARMKKYEVFLNEMHMIANSKLVWDFLLKCCFRFLFLSIDVCVCVFCQCEMFCIVMRLWMCQHNKDEIHRVFTLQHNEYCMHWMCDIPRRPMLHTDILMWIVRFHAIVLGAFEWCSQMGHKCIWSIAFFIPVWYADDWMYVCNM